MAIFKCKMCGGIVEFTPGATVGECDSCGTKQTLPKLDDEQRANLYGRANHFRRNSDYDKAMGIYEQILNEDKTDAEAYWSIVLCRYGIEYVEDPKTHKRIPTVNRAQYTSIFADADYQSALQYADTMQKSIYEAEAKAIDDIQKGILEISQKEEPFDVFICYKETDAAGQRTPDSVLANDLYHQLVQEGFKVFFSRITLEDKLGSEYEPYIFAALNSAKVMVVLGTKPEYFNAVWVKNEWSRYLTLVKASDGKKMLIPAYKDMDPYDLPDAFSNLQAQDMSKLGFMQDLIRGIRKIVHADEPKPVKETVVVQNTAPTSSNYSGLLKRAYIFLEDGKWAEADEYCEKVLDADPECAEAYLGKLLAALHISKREDLRNAAEPFDGNDNCKKASRYDAKLAKELADANAYIRERNETAQKEKTYQKAITESQKGTEEGYAKATVLYTSIFGYKDAKKRADECRKKAVEARNEAIYKTANVYKTNAKIADVEIALQKFESILDYKDALTKADECRKKIEDLKIKQEKEEAERKQREAEEAEAKRIAAEKRNKLIKKIAIIGTPAVAALIVFIILLNSVIIPGSKYNAAVDLYNSGKLDEAISAFTALNGYKDSDDQITKCEVAIKDSKYTAAVDLLNAEKYDEAITAFKALEGYKDSTDQITKCETAIKDIKYNAAVELYNAGKYEEAIAAFTALDGYKDSNDQITKCDMENKDAKYNAAVAMLKKGDIINAYEIFDALYGYKDCAEKAKEIYGQYKIAKLKAASVGDIIYFGSYEQDNNTSDGKEEIEWEVLAVEDKKVLLLSEYCLEYRDYWYMRSWLNDTFYNEAFDSNCKNMIVGTTVTADKNPKYNTSSGNDTTDKVFLLSITEYERYGVSRYCRGTAYCYAQGENSYGYGYCRWWLRTPGINDRCTVIVNGINGIVYTGYNRSYKCSVRPAIWIEVD